MDKESIRAKMAAATERFKELQGISEQHRIGVEQAEDEMKRLQGEYRALESLLNESDPAKMVNVEPTLAAEDKKVPAKK